MKKPQTVRVDNLPEALSEHLRLVRGGILELSRQSGLSRPTIYRILNATGDVKAHRTTWRRLHKVVRCRKPASRRKVGEDPYDRLNAMVEQARGLEGEALLRLANAVTELCMTIFRSKKMNCAMHVHYDGHDTRRRLILKTHPSLPVTELSILADPGRLLYELYMIYEPGGTPKRERFGDFSSTIVSWLVKNTAQILRRIKRSDGLSPGEEFRQRCLNAQLG